MSVLIPSAKQVREQAVRDAINSLMADCTPHQVERLHSIHAASPWKSLDKCPDDRLNETYELVRRTVLKNMEPPHA